MRKLLDLKNLWVFFVDVFVDGGMRWGDGEMEREERRLMGSFFFGFG